ncbi:hypothetical protein NP233_g1758 [Leucocoprinus birnbaumii]|uniref:Nephrocystin 3-like N-terminal domain-containing protein n=1 Tax=Leucocoprinus birnbaumii TaxID=56174 RepID=A0AAD5VZI7_9AGAR|nr:hypothetical protein NP233_g1758 [Leucocoprinus birnbaumii]
MPFFEGSHSNVFNHPNFFDGNSTPNQTTNHNYNGMYSGNFSGANQTINQNQNVSGQGGVLNNLHGSHAQATQPSVVDPQALNQEDRADSQKAFSAMSTARFLEGAHNFTIGHATMVAQNPDSNSAALQYLARKAMPGAMLDSAERSYPPRCDPDTRQRLRDRIVEWSTREKDDWRLLWLSGPAGVGKSAVAQTVAEEFRDMGRLAAAIFLSRPNHRDDPNAVIPTLVYQLAIGIPQYKYLITQRLADDPLIFDKNYRAQFRELITNPFNLLMTQHRDAFQHSLLIVIDGLDECSSRPAQREFVEIIGRHACSAANVPLKWMICSRSEHHLKLAFSKADQHISCYRERLDVDDEEARQDGWRMLHRGFAEIRGNYEDQLYPAWPPRRCLRVIADVASGHLGFISFILRFIGDEEYNDPDSQLQVCMEFLERPQAEQSRVVNPLLALDLLYHQILSDIPPKDLPIAMLILGVAILQPHEHLSAQNLANFLDLTQASFYRSLQRLHSVIYVPPTYRAFLENIHVYHASFSDYLLNPERSGTYHLDQVVVYSMIVSKSIKWLKYATSIPADPGAQEPPLKWIDTPTDWDLQLFSLSRYAGRTGWSLFGWIPVSQISTIMSDLDEIDFNRLPTVNEGFAIFLRWFFLLGDASKDFIKIMRVNPSFSDLALEEIPDGHRLVKHDTPNFTQFVVPFMPILGYDDLSKVPSPITLKVQLGVGQHRPAHFLLCVSDTSTPWHWNPRSLDSPHSYPTTPPPLPHSPPPGAQEASLGERPSPLTPAFSPHLGHHAGLSPSFSPAPLSEVISGAPLVS